MFAGSNFWEVCGGNIFSAKIYSTVEITFKHRLLVPIYLRRLFLSEKTPQNIQK